MSNLPTSHFNKVPEITLWFWIMKIMSTTVGETDADYLIFDLKFGLPNTILIVFCILGLALFMQFRSKAFSPFFYWISIILISIFGTLVTDFLTDIAKIDLVVSAAIFTIALENIFVLWFKQEKTISIHEINTPKREIFYWTAIFATFALGTALGDWFSESLKIGYFYSTLIFAGLISIIYALFCGKLIDATTGFWIAYILTRPFGASLGDYLSQTKGNGGLGLGASHVSAYFGIILLASLIYATAMNFISNARNRKIAKNSAKFGNED